MSCSGTIWILFMGTLECARVVEILLRLTDGSIPAPPFDLVMARAERCTFRDKSGVLVTPLQQQPSHYHIVHEQLSQKFFIPLALHVPPDFLPKLTIILHEYLQLLFGLVYCTPHHGSLVAVVLLLMPLSCCCFPTLQG